VKIAGPFGSLPYRTPSWGGLGGEPFAPHLLRGRPRQAPTAARRARCSPATASRYAEQDSAGNVAAGPERVLNGARLAAALNTPSGATASPPARVSGYLVRSSAIRAGLRGLG
jgi:hypothetical protein